jgi:glycosyltransferase involved in cell wall biosynthesis
MTQDSRAEAPFLVSVVLPAHDEAAGIERAVRVVGGVLDGCAPRWEIVVVDDGSRDGTFERLAALAATEPRVKALRLSRNFGKEAALLAGLRAARGDAVVTMDADLQHPPALIPAMVERWRGGAKVVDGVKRSRATDGALTRWRARVFNRLITRLGGVDLENASDFKLLDRMVVQAIARELPERQRFYRGLSEWVGYTRESLPFDVEERLDGQGKWTLPKLVDLAMTALLSFTSAPLRVVTCLGLLTMVFGLYVAGDALVSRYRGIAVSGFATTIITLLIIGSFIMISLGIIGEYIAKIYDEIKARPAYLVERSVGLETAPQAEAEALQARAGPGTPPPATVQHLGAWQ